MIGRARAPGNCRDGLSRARGIIRLVGDVGPDTTARSSHIPKATVENFPRRFFMVVTERHIQRAACHCTAMRAARESWPSSRCTRSMAASADVPGMLGLGAWNTLVTLLEHPDESDASVKVRQHPKGSRGNFFAAISHLREQCEAFGDYAPSPAYRIQSAAKKSARESRPHAQAR